MYIFLHQFQVTHENKTQGTYKLPNIFDKKNKAKKKVSI